MEENNYESKKLELKKYHEKIKKDRDKLNQDKLEFKAYKTSEENKLKEKLLANEINHNEKLEKEKIKQLENLKDNFLKETKTEYGKIQAQFIDLTQRETQLEAKQKDFMIQKKKFDTEQILFDSQKEKLLNEYKQELETQKEIFFNQQEENKVKKLEEINKKIEKLYEDKENEYNIKSHQLIQKESELKVRENEVAVKEKHLEAEKKRLYNEAKEKVSEELKTLEQKLKAFEKNNQGLRDELDEFRDELNNYEKFEDRDLPQELEEKRKEVNRLNKLLKEKIEEKNLLQAQKDKDFCNFEEQFTNLRQENQDFRVEIKKIEQIKSDNQLLKDKDESNIGHIEYLKGENHKLRDNLNSIYSQGKEQELREKEIKEKVYLKRKLEDNNITLRDEIGYLDTIQSNMREYGVEYPKRLLYAFHTALKSAEFSPLSVLSGVSGTGKSELPKLYSHFGGFNFLAEAVQPTWDSPESMMGYFNTIENKFDSTNILKFLVQASQSRNVSEFGLKESMNMILLDEMNLSHIELYFAEFLSKFEQRRGNKGINLDIKLGTGMIMNILLDRNTLWVGTMNEDETTKSLSDKVLDRAFSINFPRPDQLMSRNKIKILDDIKKFEYLERDKWDSWIQKESLFTSDKIDVMKKYKTMTDKINKELSTTGKAIGHRVWQSMEYYIQNHPLVIQSIDDDQALAKEVKLAYEEQLVQKIMPKLRGIETHGKEKEVLQNINSLLNQEEFKITEDFELSMSNPYGQFIWNSANYLKED